MPALQRSPVSLPEEFWGIVSFFNPAGYTSKLANLTAFAQGIRSQGLKLLVIELVFGDAAFEVQEHLCDKIVRRRTSCVMWHKERILNVALHYLPASCNKVAWLDGDILFENDDWVNEASRRLEFFVVVQPYDTACWLPEGVRSPQEVCGDKQWECMPGMGWRMSCVPDRREALASYSAHGHPGFAWAARRELLEKHGLYDGKILGGGDLVIGHAMYGTDDIWNGLHRQFISTKQYEHICRWRRKFYKDVNGSVSSVPGRALHLWHGNKTDRQYLDRHLLLKHQEFDPEVDLAKDTGQCWRWASDKAKIHEWARQYFFSRKED